MRPLNSPYDSWNDTSCFVFPVCQLRIFVSKSLLYVQAEAYIIVINLFGSLGLIFFPDAIAKNTMPVFCVASVNAV